jgi:hypothetical protein
MTIVAIRGTLGAGKTTCVQRVIEHFGKMRYHQDFLGGKKRIVGHFLSDEIFIVGSYTSDCGGVDRLFWQGRNVAEYLFNLVMELSKDYHIVFESLATSQWEDRLVELHKQRDLRIIQLMTPLEQCLQSVKQRRNKRAEETGRPVTSLTKTRKLAENIHRRSFRQAEDLEEVGLTVKFLHREEAFIYLRDTLLQRR